MPLLPFSDASLPTTDASQLTTGTLADARLSSNVPLKNATNTFSVGQTITNGTANTATLTASYSVTGTSTTPLLDLSGAWSTTGTATAIKFNLTSDSGPSNASSLLMDLQVGGLSKITINKSGNIGFGASVTGIIQTQNGNTWISGGYAQNTFINSDGLRFGTSGDVRIERDAANTLAQRNGTNAQLFRIYNTYTDASNYERGYIDWTTTANTLTIGTQSAGTGTGRGINITTNGGTRIAITPSGTINLSSTTNIASGYSFAIQGSTTPASSSASGNTGVITWDANYIYVCIATSTWKRTPILTW